MASNSKMSDTVKHLDPGDKDKIKDQNADEVVTPRKERTFRVPPGLGRSTPNKAVCLSDNGFMICGLLELEKLVGELKKMANDLEDENMDMLEDVQNLGNKIAELGGEFSEVSFKTKAITKDVKVALETLDWR